ncbi:outer membrane protein TolC [Hydrogenivirga caldilitoris]|uniref:Outer membrane protein TolC n=1 Tax=Hydrogenivirga caldilitoris TaxID=246264 RepID=A0A497XT48_9AQUI|nr:TolC family protein [Hydrogenivirga caldilitoris]RLJ70302.1 outer membrane protein TolC [Hydrogenivirga caldilitoris]
MRVLLLLFLFTFSYSITLEEAVQLALKRNIESIKSELDLKKVEERIREVKGSVLPTVSFSARYTRWDPNYISSFVPENKYILTLSLNQPIFDKSVWDALRLAKRSRELQEAVIKDVKTSLKAEVEKLYWAVLLKREVLKEKEESLTYWENYFKLVEEKYKEGIVPKYEFLRARAQLRQARADLIRAKSDYTVSLNSLKNLIGVDEDITVEGTFGKGTLKIEDPRETLIKNNTSLLVLEKTLKVQRENVELKKADYYPKLSLFANYNVENIKDFKNGSIQEEVRKGYNLGVSLDFTIYDGQKRSARVMQEKLEEMKVREEIEFRKRELLNQLDSLLSQLKALEEELLAREDTLLASEESLRNATERYREGVGSQVELLDARKAYEEARLSYLDSVYVYNSTIADLKALLGF